MTKGIAAGFARDPYDYWRYHCYVCRGPISQPLRGRRRRTCSEACRTRLHRDRVARSDEGRWDKRCRAAERVLRRWEKRFGPLDLPIPGEARLTLRDRLHFRLTRDIPIKLCERCGRPFVRDQMGGHPIRYCTDECMWASGEDRRALREALAGHAGACDPRVDVRRGLGLPLAVCAQCGKPYPRYDKRRRTCSDACRQAAYRARWGKCLNCRGRFRKGSTRGKAGIRHKFCSDHCADNYWKRHNRKSRAKPSLPTGT